MTSLGENLGQYGFFFFFTESRKGKKKRNVMKLNSSAELSEN